MKVENTAGIVTITALVLGGSALLLFSPRHGAVSQAVAQAPEHATIIDDIDLGNGEHLRVVEIPDRIMPYRCVILTSGGHSQIHCPADAAAPSP